MVTSEVKPEDVGDGFSLAHKTYSALVKDEEDLIGYIAYALYKREKLKFCEKCRQDSGTEPSKEEVATFVGIANLDIRRSAYRDQAAALLESFAEIQLNDTVDGIVRGYEQKLAAELQKSKSWSRFIGESLLSSFLSTVLWVAVAAVFVFTKISPQTWVKLVTDTGVDPNAVIQQDNASRPAPVPTK